MLRANQKFGKYRIRGKVADGGFATVYRAQDTITDTLVALKVPHAGHATNEALEDFRKEVRLMDKLDHPNILPIKDAGFIDDIFFIAYPLGTKSLADRMGSRMSIKTIVDLCDQMLAALAFAHGKRIMHCDVKPENFILFPENRLRLTDFGIAKVARRTLVGSGTGTIGYIAPEQAMGQPSFRSDVFSLGLVFYKMLTGHLPSWPFEWPPPGIERLRKTVHPDVLAMLRRSLEVDHRKRYADAGRLYIAFRKLRPKLLRSRPAVRRKRNRHKSTRDWRTIRLADFTRRFGRLLDVHGECQRCGGPVSERMPHCCWCGTKRRVPPDETRFGYQCPRCNRGVKADWRYCPWCYGPAIAPDMTPRYTDSRYDRNCPHAGCRGPLMPFMRYCPWCRRKVTKSWKIEGVNDRCSRCGWGILKEFWDHCPWCAKRIGKP